MQLGVKKLSLAPVSLMIAFDSLRISGTRTLVKNSPPSTRRIASNASLCSPRILRDCERVRATPRAELIFGFAQRNRRALIQSPSWQQNVFWATSGRALSESATSLGIFDDASVQKLTESSQAEFQVSSSTFREDNSLNPPSTEPDERTKAAAQNVSDDGSPQKTKKRRSDRRKGGGPAKGELLELVCESLAFKVGAPGPQWLLLGVIITRYKR